MARYTPTVHPVFNEFDRHGLLLGLTRLRGEKNSSYKQRLLDVMVNRASSTYRGLINGITRELGLTIDESIRITTVKDSDGVPLLTMPAITFQGTKCYVYSDYVNSTLLLTLDRWETNGGVWTLSSLVDRINATGYFVATLLDGANSNARSMTIFDQSTIGQVGIESIVGGAGRHILKNTNLISGSVAVSSPNLSRRVSSESELTMFGDYYINLASGIVHATVAPAPGSIIRYEYRNDETTIKTSPVIIHKTYSDDFKTKMFEQILDEDGNAQNGKPTRLGANIINELMSVFPANWGN